MRVLIADDHPRFRDGLRSLPEAQALTKDVVNIGPGERYDLLSTADNPGTWLSPATS